MFAAASARRLSVIPTHREYLGAQRGQVVLHGLGLEERTLEPKQLDPQALKVMTQLCRDPAVGVRNAEEA